MKKIRLVGKKLYRVGPLKCYKDNHHGHGSGGVYSSARPQGYGSGTGGRAFDTLETTRLLNEKQRAAELKKEEAARAEVERKEKLVADALKNDPTRFRSFIDSPDPDIQKAAQEAADAEEGKKEAQARKDIIAKKKLKNLSQGLILL